MGRLGEGGAGLATEALPAGEGAEDDDAVVELVPMLRRVVGSRIKDPHTVDDLVQETLLRVMAARGADRAREAPSVRRGDGPQPRRVAGRAERARTPEVAPARRGDRRRVAGRRPPPPGGAVHRRCRACQPSGGRPGPARGLRGGRPGHAHDRGWPPIDAGSGRRTPQPCPREPARRVPAGGRGPRAADGPMPAGAPSALDRRPASTARAGRQRSPLGLLHVRPGQDLDVRAPRTSGR